MPEVEFCEDTPVADVLVPAQVVPEEDGVLAADALASDGDEVSNSTVPCGAAMVKDVTRRSMSRMKDKKTSKSPSSAFRFLN